MKPMVIETCSAPVPRWRPHRSTQRRWGVPLRPFVACGALFVLNALSVTVTTASVSSAEPSPKSGLLVRPEGIDVSSAERVLEAEPGQVYGAGTRLRISPTDWSFAVPEAWKSSRPPESDLPLLMSLDGQGLGLIFPLRNVTREAIRAQLEEPLSLLHGLAFVPAGSLKETEGAIGATYSGEGMVGHALAVFGPDDVCVMYFIMGPGEEASDYDAVLQALQRTTRFEESRQGAEGQAPPL